ncbi:hypothetical protein PMSM_26790 [Paenibacillus macquariensis subsp. macquariensis]|uniref:hypothetical protein n=1 Tax=Paenibacillus macquariensis TaxID=948756 RepID=UPI0007C338AA|nr:hypothetical protein [Paenibacillus macquariensis]OAB26362.1 hypothetical protein PMSM_26790 [Paenibacillus macquariensis subsp. macquariensis]
MDQEGDSLKRFDMYTLIKAFPDETLKCYPEVLIYDATENQWYLFSDKERKSINQLLENGFFKIISNTIV